VIDQLAGWLAIPRPDPAELAKSAERAKALGAPA
jgi:hypothetical protein